MRGCLSGVTSLFSPSPPRLSPPRPLERRHSARGGRRHHVTIPVSCPRGRHHCPIVLEDRLIRHLVLGDSETIEPYAIRRQLPIPGHDVYRVRRTIAGRFARASHVRRADRTHPQPMPRPVTVQVTTNHPRGCARSVDLGLSRALDGPQMSPYRDSPTHLEYSEAVREASIREVQLPETRLDWPQHACPTVPRLHLPQPPDSPETVELRPQSRRFRSLLP